MMYLSLFLATILTWSQAKLTKAECAERDYSSRLGPVQDQGYLGTCYSYAASALVSFEVGTQVSPAQIALVAGSDSQLFQALTSIYEGRDKFFCRKKIDPESVASRVSDGGGLISETIETTNRIGFCRESSFPSSESFFLGLDRNIENFWSCNKGKSGLPKQKSEIVSDIMKLLSYSCDSKRLFINKTQKYLMAPKGDIFERRKLIRKTSELVEKRTNRSCANSTS